MIHTFINPRWWQETNIVEASTMLDSPNQNSRSKSDPAINLKEVSCNTSNNES